MKSFWGRLFARRRSERLDGMARVRVYTRVKGGARVPMVGYLPRAALEEIRRRMRAVASGGREADFTATPRAAERVRVILPALGDGEAHPAWRIHLGLRIQEASARGAAVPARISVELRDLLREAHRFAQGAPERTTAGVV
jgi:hypothetical protein